MKKKAFTLIELIIVMGIISLMLSIIAIRFDIVKKVKEKNEINTILADMNYCKEKARVTGVKYSFSIDGSNSYSIRRAYIDNTSNNSTSIKKEVDLEVIEITHNNLKDNDVITFKPSGSVANPGTISLSGLDSKYSLSVGVAGANIQVKKK